MKSRAYRTIKDLVFDVIRQTKGSVDYETVTKAVLENFPKSAWKRSHWGYYRSQITSKIGRFRDKFPEKIRANLRRRAGKSKVLMRKAAKIQKKGKETKEDKVKRIGDGILENARFVIEVAAGNNAQIRFKLNRWVYSRLLQEEIRAKRPVKQTLWDSGKKRCQNCGQEFKSIKGVEIHRKDSSKIYSVENCELLCRPCHQHRQTSGFPLARE